MDVDETPKNQVGFSAGVCAEQYRTECHHGGIIVHNYSGGVKIGSTSLGGNSASKDV